jgi:hypothetical protein
MAVRYGAQMRGFRPCLTAVRSSGTAEVRRFMAASACAYVRASSHSAERFALPTRATGEEASRDVITSTMAFVHVLHEVSVRDTIAGGSSATGG